MSTAIGHPPILSNSYLRLHTPPMRDYHAPSADVYVRYEIGRTVSEITSVGWRTVALQFADEMLADAPSVCEALRIGLAAACDPLGSSSSSSPKVDPKTKIRTRDDDAVESATERMSLVPYSTEIKLYILGDTSYGACCVDEIAAQHVDADVVVHYGRACLSPTARLPVIYVFTIQPLAINSVVAAFQKIFLDVHEQVILMADLSFTSYLPHLTDALTLLGYINIHKANVVHDLSSPLPNRTAPDEVYDDPTKLKNWQIFHISQPPDSLLLILSSRVSRIHIFSTSNVSSTVPVLSPGRTTELALRRRYALLTSLSSASIFGILVNTLSVKNYLDVVERVKRQIVAAGKKYYLVIVGKINAAKMANFSEIGGWVVVGCWESSLIESNDFWKPVITPFELDLALKAVDERVWTGKWISDFQSVLEEPEMASNAHVTNRVSPSTDTQRDEIHLDDSDSEPESSPPEFDLRTGRYVSHTRPLRRNIKTSSPAAISNSLNSPGNDRALTKQHNDETAMIGGTMSPGADFLTSKRTWKGLGSDFEIAYEDADISLGAIIEEGRNGIARGYTVGSEASRT